MKQNDYMNLEQYPDVITVDELRQIMRIGKASAYQLLHDGELQYRRIGRIYRISKNSLAEYLNGK